MKERKRNKFSLILEFGIWGAILTFGIIGLVCNFVYGRLVSGIVYSIITLLSLGGLIFNIVYLSKHLGDDPHLPKE